MIELDFGVIFLIFVGMPLLITGILALMYNFKSMHRRLRIRESIYECSDCGNVYAFARTRPMDRCPRCGHLNEAVRT